MPPLSQCLVLRSTTPNRPTSLPPSARRLAMSGGTFLETTPRIPKTRLITRPSCLRRRPRGGEVRAKERGGGARPSSEARARCTRVMAWAGGCCLSGGFRSRRAGLGASVSQYLGLVRGASKHVFFCWTMRSVDISQREHEDWVTVGESWTSGTLAILYYTWEFGRTTSQPFMMAFLRKHVDPVLSLSFDRRLLAAFPAICGHLVEL